MRYAVEEVILALLLDGPKTEGELRLAFERAMKKVDVADPEGFWKALLKMEALGAVKRRSDGRLEIGDVFGPILEVAKKISSELRG